MAASCLASRTQSLGQTRRYRLGGCPCRGGTPAWTKPECPRLMGQASRNDQPTSGDEPTPDPSSPQPSRSHARHRPPTALHPTADQDCWRLSLVTPSAPEAAGQSNGLIGLPVRRRAGTQLEQRVPRRAGPSVRGSPPDVEGEVSARMRHTPAPDESRSETSGFARVDDCYRRGGVTSRSATPVRRLR